MYSERNFVWCCVLFQRWKYILCPRFCFFVFFWSSWTTWDAFHSAFTSVDGGNHNEHLRKATNVGGVREHTGHVLSTVNFLSRNPLVVFRMFFFPFFAHEHCRPLHFNLDSPHSLCPSLHLPQTTTIQPLPLCCGVSTYCC